MGMHVWGVSRIYRHLVLDLLNRQLGKANEIKKRRDEICQFKRNLCIGNLTAAKKAIVATNAASVNPVEEQPGLRTAKAARPIANKAMPRPIANKAMPRPIANKAMPRPIGN